ncbi:hypothetical protein GGTG_12690 [Gaeumannomyces tritici R3-111a-1]|uniref:Uncharacterized protein n=1 Tax=Gaeumannomyces tritici (strain R3-111a-1) TaxID=644352 RepID=J3PGR1_GAET3|nr:hypothetical protein GGTG_12690 [Gaeumannomyces tritici R3-111a-1]EJT69807.1 hypothetical protein GGTG_12690 [Gaeumannomyces tritici R3-111a-1]
MSPAPGSDEGMATLAPPLPHETNPHSPAPSEPPPAPNPASDPRLAKDHEPSAVTSPTTAGKYGDGTGSSLRDLPADIFQIPARATLQLLADSVEALVHLTGDIPPSPAPERPEMPHMRGMDAEKKDIVRSHSERTLVRMRLEAEAAAARTAESQQSSAAHVSAANAGGSSSQEAIEVDGVRLRNAPQPIPPPSSPEPYVVVGANQQPVNVQHSAITRKFYSRNPPPISIGDYLRRLHRFCPASPAVYLAASVYITRLAVDDRAIAVTRRNAHRLLLASVRVATKALEDRSWPHRRFAQVGGISVAELTRLEISFCFLAGFELLVSPEAMRRHWVVMRDSPMGGASLGEFGEGGSGRGRADGALEMSLPSRQKREPDSSDDQQHQ